MQESIGNKWPVLVGAAEGRSLLRYRWERQEDGEGAQEEAEEKGLGPRR